MSCGTNSVLAMTRYSWILFFFLAGCAVSRASVAVHDVVLLPEERIFTVPAGQLINVELDGKPMQMTFPHPMKLAYESVLVRQEEKLNQQILKTAKSDKEKKQMVGIVGSAVGGLASILWIVARRKKLINIDTQTKVQV